MAVKVIFEMGHMSKLKSKKTADGFTHDWEIYVRGIDKNDIGHYIEKVIFNLHDSFPKPKRVFKDTPFVIKESGYAGFIVPIDVYFKNRDEPKRVTYNYDLDLQQTGPPVHKCETKKFVFNNPSDEFRRKLLKGGGIVIINNPDEKSRELADERSQLNKPKLCNDTAKKLKNIRPDESFQRLFGPPITKSSSKVSPDPKTKIISNVNPSVNKSIKNLEKIMPSSSSLSSSIKDKMDKTEKKDKHKHASPHKEKLDAISKENNKKLDDKHDRRDDKKKDKSHSKERDRSKEKNLKRPWSPTKITPSPKRISPPRSSSAAGRGVENGYKGTTKTDSEALGGNNTSDKSQNSSTGSSNASNKRSKKEKKSHDKDKDRYKKDKERDKTGISSSMIGSAGLNHPTNSNTKVSTPDIKIDYSKTDNENTSNIDLKDIKKVTSELKPPEPSINKKQIDPKQDKDEEKHKHKKEDKNKEKDKDRDHGTKERKDRSSKKDDIKKITQINNEPMLRPQQKPNSNPLTTLIHEINERDSSDSDVESTPASVSEKPENNTESSNSSFQEVTKQNTYDDKKDRKTKDKLKINDKDENKRKRKSKDDIDSQIQAATIGTARPSISSNINAINEPPIKQIKKDDLILKNGEKSYSPHVPLFNQQTASLQITVDDTKAFRTPSTSLIPIASTSNNNNNHNMIHDRGLTVDYMSELHDLQQKIMSLQDNNELQELVEMIAATGQFEITNNTFDFDLCALDRHTVQRLQDFFANCSLQISL